MIDVIRSIDAHERRKQRPGTECAGGERGDMFGDGGWRIDGRGVVDARCKG